MNLYFRLLLLLLLRVWRLPRRGVLEESRAAFRVLPNDCDINFHLNNGRYLSFMDLGRVHLMAQRFAVGDIEARLDAGTQRRRNQFHPFDSATTEI